MCKRERLAINVLPAHKRAIERMAQADGEPMSVIIRQFIRKEAKARGLWPKAKGQPEEAQTADIARERVSV